MSIVQQHWVCVLTNEFESFVIRYSSLGEFEIVPHYQKLFAGQPFVCANPTGLEVKTVDDREPAATGDTFRFTLKEGFYCLNQIVKPKKKKCTDYKLKFCCPA